jgi:hypothetical protein
MFNSLLPIIVKIKADKPTLVDIVDAYPITNSKWQPTFNYDTMVAFRWDFGDTGVFNEILDPWNRKFLRYANRSMGGKDLIYKTTVEGNVVICKLFFDY